MVWQTPHCTVSQPADQQGAIYPLTAVMIVVQCCQGSTALLGDVLTNQGPCGLRQHMFAKGKGAAQRDALA